MQDFKKSREKMKERGERWGEGEKKVRGKKKREREEKEGG